MIIPILPMEAAREGLEKRRNDENWTAIPYVRPIGEGEEFDQSGIATLLQKLLDLKNSLPDPLPVTKGKDFEGPACEIVHSSLALDPVAASSREFWLWLTFAADSGQFASLVDWRFGTQEHINEINYGIATRAGIWEGLFARLWLRGNMGFDPNADDPYDIAKRGDVDIWRSHVIRQEYGRCRSATRALIQYQHPTSSSDTKTLKVKELRELAKRLRIIDASTSFEMLTEDQVTTLIGESVAAIKETT